MTIRRPIYLDYNATTPVDPRVEKAMQPYLGAVFGNAASRSHSFGWEAEKAVTEAREAIATLIGATPAEIIFTSGATESDNLALKGVAHMLGLTRADRVLLEALAKAKADGSLPDPEALIPGRLGSVNLQTVLESGVDAALPGRGDHIITVTTEHKAILDTAKRLEREGFRVTYLPVQQNGQIDLAELEAAMTKQTLLVSVMLANNELGVLQPIEAIGKLCKAKKVLFHTDAVQAIGKIPVDVNALGVDLLSISAHKFYGPKGVGALYVRRRRPRVRLQAAIDGGGHERGMRSGTLNVSGIVGFGAAAKLAMEDMEAEGQRLRRMTEGFLAKLRANLDYISLNGSETERIPGTLNISFAYVEGEALMMAMKGVAVSSGSACTSASLEPSYVLRALGVGDEMAHSSIRFGFGRYTTQEEVDEVADLIIDKVQKLREMSPLYEMAKEGIDLSQIEWTAH